MTTDKTGADGDTVSGESPAADETTAEPEKAKKNCGCGTRRDAIMTWLSRIWARLRSVFGPGLN